MIRHLVFAFWSCFVPFMGFASQVVWGGGTIIDRSTDPMYSESGYDNLTQWLWTIDEIYIKPNVFFTQIRSKDGITISGVEFSWGAYGTVVSAMEKGSVIDASSMSGVTDPFTETKINYGSSIILGFETESYEGIEMVNGYGWVEIAAEYDGLTIRDGAYGMNGQAMYAGGGATPEPTSGLLVLLGLAMLSLQRRTGRHLGLGKLTVEALGPDATGKIT